MNKEEINPENCRLLLATYMEEANIAAPTIAKAIPCRHSTLGRILIGSTVPTEDFVKQIGIMMGIGFERYAKLSETDKEKISESIGVAAGSAIGFGSIAAAVGASGTVVGLSAAGITSGLAAIGGTVGGGMAAGVATVAAIPLAAGAIGYGIIKGVKYFFSESKLNKTELDPRWEAVKTAS